MEIKDCIGKKVDLKKLDKEKVHCGDNYWLYDPETSAVRAEWIGGVNQVFSFVDGSESPENEVPISYAAKIWLDKEGRIKSIEFFEEGEPFLGCLRDEDKVKESEVPVMLLEDFEDKLDKIVVQ